MNISFSIKKIRVIQKANILILWKNFFDMEVRLLKIIDPLSLSLSLSLSPFKLVAKY